MDGMLSQEEINALLGGLSGDTDIPSNTGETVELSPEEKDVLGEISNICMGTAATTLYSLVNQRVSISTPKVMVCTWEELSKEYSRPCVFINIDYVDGVKGNNLLILMENDVKIITDLMMGGDGTNLVDQLTDLHLSAICEAMNQMMGSAATSLSSMLNKKIDISPPVADLIDLTGNIDEGAIDDFLTQPFVKISFKMEIGDLVDSEIMQLYPVSFAREMCKSITETMTGGNEPIQEAAPQPAPAPAPQPQASQPAPQPQPMMNQQPMMGQPMMGQPMMGQPVDMSAMYANQQVNVQPAQFQNFTGDMNGVFPKENIDLIMDVPLEVTVELGRTSKSIHDILDFAPGTIIELNKIAGEPIDVLVNGKYVAKGEVVVIEESFGVRITEIIK